MIHICDAIMGSGKTQSAITYMNEHPDKRFVYITPFLPEAERIADGCPALRFRQPSDKIVDYHFSKIEHTRALLAEGRNVTTTHSAFKLYTPDMVESVVTGEYTLIVDEAVSMLSEVEFPSCDIELFRDAGYLQFADGVLHYTGKEYPEGGMLSALYKLIRYNDVFHLTDRAGDEEAADVNDSYFYWETAPDTLRAFKDVFILTYLFNGQDMKTYLEKMGMEYRYIGISRRDDGSYCFSDTMEYYPEYIANLDKMVRIWDHRKMNAIGEVKHALSKSWFSKHAKDDVVQLKKNVRTYLGYHFAGVPSTEVLWSTFKDFEKAIHPSGYANGFLACNARASNEYRKRHVLAYCVNLFINPFLKRYLTVGGMEPDDDLFALSTMIQWIWRSAIRDGKPIDIYIPSKRMRTLLRNWIAETQAAYHAHMKGGAQREA